MEIKITFTTGTQGRCIKVNDETFTELQKSLNYVYGIEKYKILCFNKKYLMGKNELARLLKDVRNIRAK